MQNEPKPTIKIKSLNPQARHHARHFAVQAFYHWQMTGAAMADIEQEFVQHHIRKGYDQAYFQELIQQIPKHKAQLDDNIKPFLNRSLTEIDPIEYAVLLVAIYELVYRLDVPYRVIINEALELTKKFGSVEGYKFINGILDRVAKTIRADEINM